MPRHKLTVAYDGTDFHGWQEQHPPGAEPPRTVQGVLQHTVRTIVREPVNVTGASRTDAGVHARGQVAAFTSNAAIPLDRLSKALNSRLPRDVLVSRVVRVRDDFEPITDAVAKGYRYCIAHGGSAGAPRPLFDRNVITFSAYELDAARMAAAARAFVGRHDFASFTRVAHGRQSTVREIHDCRVTATSRRRLRIDVSGDGFLYNMVRIIAGTLMEVGRGRVEPDAIPAMLAARDRTAAGATAPPEGLCLMWVRYRRGAPT